MHLASIRVLACLPLLVLAGFFALAQPPERPAASPADPSPSPSPVTDDRPLREGLKSMAENSRNLSGWGLTIVGGSILAIISTSYMRPLSRKIRLAYLLFIPGWVLIGWSLYYGDSISRRNTAATFAMDRKTLSEIGRLMNHEFASQLTFFNYGLLIFSIWLMIYIVWWVAVDLPPAQNRFEPVAKRRRRRLL